ncbi:MAG: hypothetical protein ACREP0_14435, partial [Rhodanobacteraceae bacterium]
MAAALLRPRPCRCAALQRQSIHAGWRSERCGTGCNADPAADETALIDHHRHRHGRGQAIDYKAIAGTLVIDGTGARESTPE